MKNHLQRVLLVEENHHIVSVLTQNLKEDFEVTLATTGTDALRLLFQGYHFDSIITELNLPSFSGIELIKTVRMNSLINHTPILVLSGALDSQTRIAWGAFQKFLSLIKIIGD